MGENKKYKKYDHSKTIARHLGNLSQQISSLESIKDEHWSSYFNSVVMSISFLDGLLDPFKDEEFDEIFQEDKDFGRTKGEQVKFVHSAMKEYFNLMYRRNLFYASHTETEIGGKNDG